MKPKRSIRDRLIAASARLAMRLHRDERGTISIATVFAIFMFTILLVKIVNVGRHIDDKLRMQNAADASAYSSGVVIARGMNLIAFTNHLEAEIFALTAYMREGRDRNAESLVPPILDMWEQVGRVFEQHGGSSDFTKFERLGRAIQLKVPLERDVVANFGEMTHRHSELTLPVFEYILAGGDRFSGQQSPEGGFIPRFQRAVVRATPYMAQLAAEEIAERYGTSTEHLRLGPGRGQRIRTPLTSRIWRTDVRWIGAVNEDDPRTRTIPAIDPSPSGADGPPDPSYFEIARRQRRELARHYLEAWIRDWQGPYFAYGGRDRPGRETAKMSQYTNLYRIFACGYLDQLLDQEYPHTNLPHVIRTPASSGDPNRVLEQDHQFVSVAYWRHLDEMFPGLFKNRLKRNPGSDALTFAQVSVFVPRNRYLCCPWARPYWVEVPQPDGTVTHELRWVIHREGRPRHWDLLNQNWTCKLVPATIGRLAEILESRPPGLPDFRPPRFDGTTREDLGAISKH